MTSSIPEAIAAAQCKRGPLAQQLGQPVSVNYNHNQSFAQYHTYAWGGSNQQQIANSILGQEAQQDINTALQSKGLQMVQENQNPDLVVTATG